MLKRVVVVIAFLYSFFFSFFPPFYFSGDPGCWKVVEFLLFVVFAGVFFFCSLVDLLVVLPVVLPVVLLDACSR